MAIAGENGAAALKEVGTLKRFSAEAPASTYAPALFSDSNFPYFTLTNGSSIKLTYNVATDEPVLYKAAANAQTLTVTDDFYQTKSMGVGRKLYQRIRALETGCKLSSGLHQRRAFACRRRSRCGDL